MKRECFKWISSTCMEGLQFTSSALHILNLGELFTIDDLQRKPQECIIGAYIFRLIMSTFLARKQGDEKNKQKIRNCGIEVKSIF